MSCLRERIFDFLLFVLVPGDGTMWRGLMRLCYLRGGLAEGIS